MLLCKLSLIWTFPWCLPQGAVVICYVACSFRMRTGQKGKKLETIELIPGELLLQATRGGETNNKRKAKMLKPEKFAIKK